MLESPSAAVRTEKALSANFQVCEKIGGNMLASISVEHLCDSLGISVAAFHEIHGRLLMNELGAIRLARLRARSTVAREFRSCAGYTRLR